MQAAVDADGSQLVLSSRVSVCASDRNELVADVDAIPVALGAADRVLADSGYATGSEVSQLEGRGVEVLVATGAEGHAQPMAPWGMLGRNSPDDRQQVQCHWPWSPRLRSGTMQEEPKRTQGGATSTVSAIPPVRRVGSEGARQIPWRVPVVSRRALERSGFPESLDREIEEMRRTDELLASRAPGASISPL